MTDTTLAKSAWGSAYNIGVSIATILLGFTRYVLLMRMLGPDEFGVVSLALFFVSFATPFSVLGVDSALIQMKDPKKEDFSTHFGLRLGLSILILLIGILVSPALRQIYHAQATVVNVFLVLLTVNILQASYSTPGIIVRRKMRFGAIAALNLAASLAMTVTAPLLAYMGAGLWSLVAEQVVSHIVRWLGFWVVLRPWRPSLRFLLEKARSMLQFGSKVLSSSLLGISLDRFDDFWIGTFLGPTALGYYSRAYDMAQYPERILATPLTNVFFPTYAAVQDDKETLSKAFFRSSSFLVRVGFLLAAILMATATEITLILFDEKWLPIVPLFRLMLVYIFLNPLYVNLSYLFMGAGQPGTLARVRLVQVIFFVITVILFASFWGTSGVAMAANLMMFTGTIALLSLSRRLVNYSLTRLFKWPIVAAILSGAIGLGLMMVTQGLHMWANLILKSIAIAGCYGLILYLTERDTIHEYGSQILKLIMNKVSTWKS